MTTPTQTPIPVTVCFATSEYQGTKIIYHFETPDKRIEEIVFNTQKWDDTQHKYIQDPEHEQNVLDTIQKLGLTIPETDTTDYDVYGTKIWLYEYPNNNPNNPKTHYYRAEPFPDTNTNMPAKIDGKIHRELENQARNQPYTIQKIIDNTRFHRFEPIIQHTLKTGETILLRVSNLEYIDDNDMMIRGTLKYHPSGYDDYLKERANFDHDKLVALDELWDRRVAQTRETVIENLKNSFGLDIEDAVGETLCIRPQVVTTGGQPSYYITGIYTPNTNTNSEADDVETDAGTEAAKPRRTRKNTATDPNQDPGDNVMNVPL